MRKISEILDTMGSKSEYSAGFHRSRAMTLWSAAAGSALAEMCAPSGFREDTLHVVAFHPAVCMEVRVNSDGILRRLNSMAGAVLFNRIVVKLADAPRERLEKVDKE